MGTEVKRNDNMRHRGRALGLAGAMAAGIACIAQAAVAATPAIQLAEQGPKPIAQASRAMASSSHPLVTQTMVDVMKQGGNALDATIAATILQSVVEPQMTTLAGSMSLLYYDAKTDSYHHLEGLTQHTREGAPTGLSSNWITRHNPPGVSDTHGRRIAVPGTAAALYAAHRRFGAIKWADYFTPAIKTAEQGFPMYSFLYGEMAANNMDKLALHPSAREEFLPGGFIPPVGTLVKRPNLAKSLRAFADGGVDWFYRGEFARKYVEAARSVGGVVTMQDLADYEPRWEQPIRSSYNGYEIVGAPAPVTGGTLIAMILNILENFDLRSMPHFSESTASLALVRQAFTLAEFYSEVYVRDPLGFGVPNDTLLSKEYAATLARLIAGSGPKGKDNARLASAAPTARGEVELALGEREPAVVMNTNQLVAVDEQGNWSALVHTLNGGTFTAGVLVDGILTNAANAYPGTGRGEGRRVMAPFAPTLIVKDGKPVVAVGSPGLSSRAVAQVLINYLGYGMDMDAAIKATRFAGSQPGTDTVIENRLSNITAESLVDYDIPVKISAPYNWHFGSMQAVVRNADGTLSGYADLRRAGRAEGY